MANVRIDELSSMIGSRLSAFSSDILAGVEEAAKTSVEEMVQETKQRPHTKRSHGDYARSIASCEGENSLTAKSRIWYVKDPDYRVTHLLNNGHRVGSSGKRYEGDQHVTHAAEKAMENFQARIEEAIKRAGD